MRGAPESSVSCVSQPWDDVALLVQFCVNDGCVDAKACTDKKGFKKNETKCFKKQKRAAVSAEHFFFFKSLDFCSKPL